MNFPSVRLVTSHRYPLVAARSVADEVGLRDRSPVVERSGRERGKREISDSSPLRISSKRCLSCHFGNVLHLHARGQGLLDRRALSHLLLFPRFQMGIVFTREVKEAS